MFTAMRRLAVAAVVLAGSMFFASSAHATFKLEVNGVLVANGDGAGQPLRRLQADDGWSIRLGFLS